MVKVDKKANKFVRKLMRDGATRKVVVSDVSFLEAENACLRKDLKSLREERAMVGFIWCCGVVVGFLISGLLLLNRVCV